MKDFDWELLHELYKNPNLTKVANVLYITQPTLTKRLQHIEAEFDVTIVERTPKGLEFTPEGKHLAEQPLEDLSQLLEQRRLWYSTNAESKKLLDEWWEEQFQQVPPHGAGHGLRGRGMADGPEGTGLYPVLSAGGIYQSLRSVPDASRPEGRYPRHPEHLVPVPKKQAFE